MGAAFQTRSNQFTKIRIKARSAVAAGNSGGWGNRCSRYSMIVLESVTTVPSSSSTGTSGWPLSSTTAERSRGSHGTSSASIPLCPSASITRSTLVDQGIASSRRLTPP